MRDTISAVVRGLAILALSGSTLCGASAQTAQPAAVQCGPDAIGLARTVEVDATGGPRFGGGQFPARPALQPGEVVLTFDDGPHKALTPKILQVLDEHCTKATFFMTGQRILTYPELAREVAQRGHTAGTHTWSHQNLARISTEAAKTEIELAFSAQHKVFGGQAAPFFRFPYLSEPKSMVAHLKARNVANMSIDVDSHDYQTRSSTLVIRNVMKNLATTGKGIILFHDIQPSTAGALKTLLTELKTKGYRVVHLVPRQEQTTIADYDRRIDREFGGRRIASLPVPMGQRGVVSPSWEVRVYRGGSGEGGSYSPSSDAYSPRAVTPPPAVRPAPRGPSDDWLGGIFRTW